MRTWLKVGENANLIVGAFFEFGVLLKFLCFHHFDGYFFLGLDIDGSVDCRIDSSADFVLQGVVLNHFSHVCVSK